MNNFILDFFQKHELPLQDKNVLVAVSTGIDSMVLLEELRRAKQTTIFHLEIVHVDHQKRDQSKLEKEYLQSYTKKIDIPLHIATMPLMREGNFQEKARNFRYGFFQKVYQDIQADYLLLAHHLYDNIETVFMKFARNASIDTFTGMYEDTFHQGMRIIRPMLWMKKEEIIALASSRHIRFFEDESNQDEVYFRNQLRHQLLPKVIEVFPDLKQNFQSFTQKVQLASDVFYQQLQHITDIMVKKDENKCSFSVTVLRQYPNALQEEILFFLLKRFDLSKAQITEILKHIYSTKANILVTLFDRFTFAKEYNTITLFYSIIDPYEVYFKIEDIGTYQIDKNRVLEVSKKKNKIIPNTNQLWYNYTMLPIVVRSKQEGDAIELSFGTKKVNDLLTDKKIGILERRKVLIVQDRNQRILSVLNYANSEYLSKLSAHDILIELKENI